MSIAHVNTQVGTPNQTGSPGLTATSTVTKPTGLAVGDLMIAYVNANTSGITTPGTGQGWTALYSQDAANGNVYRVAVYYVIATSTHTAQTSFVWSNADALSPMWAAISAYRGVDQSNPINASSINPGSTSASLSSSSITTTKTALVVDFRCSRCTGAGTNMSYSSTVTNERFDTANKSSTGYSGAAYDSGSDSSSGTQSGVSTTRSGTGTQTDSFAIKIALQSANVSVAPAPGATTAAAYNAQALTGQSVTAGRAATTAAVQTVSVFAGKVVNTVGTAAVVAAVPDVGRRVQPTAATTSAASSQTMLFFGTPSFRLKQVPAENRVIAVGTNREAAG